jgi:hypothetical protein
MDQRHVTIATETLSSTINSFNVDKICMTDDVLNDTIPTLFNSMPFNPKAAVLCMAVLLGVKGFLSHHLLIAHLLRRDYEAASKLIRKNSLRIPLGTFTNSLSELMGKE